jgi:hypothetical protein
MRMHRERPHAYSVEAVDVLRRLNSRVDDVECAVHREPCWHLMIAADARTEDAAALLREILLRTYWYQRHTTEAGFHMLGRLPKHENLMLRSLIAHKAEEAEHGEWALRDYLALGGDERVAQGGESPASVAVAGVWWWMARREPPLAYLGAEYLFEELTARLCRTLVPILQRSFAAERARFVVDHATEDVRHANLIRHWIQDAATRYPETQAAMLRSFDLFRHVYPLPVWREAFAASRGGRP